jgi:hypothetical protein
LREEELLPILTRLQQPLNDLRVLLDQRGA